MSDYIRRIYSWVTILSILVGTNTPSAIANMNSMDTYVFRPISEGLDFMSVFSSETLSMGWTKVGFFFNRSVNSLALNMQQKKFNDRSVNYFGETHIHYGVLDRWSVGAHFPFVMAESHDSGFAGGYFSKKGFLEFALYSKMQLVPRGNEWGIGMAIIPSINFPLVEDPLFLGKNPDPILNLEMAFDWEFHPLVIAAINLGYRYRNPKGSSISQLGFSLFDDQYIYSAGLTHRFYWLDSELIAEVAGSTQAKDPFRKLNSPIDLLGTYKFYYNTDLAFLGGLGAGLTKAIGSADYKIFAGVQYQFRPKKTPEIASAPMVEEVIPDRSTLILFPFDRHYLEDSEKQKLQEFYSDLLNKLKEGIKIAKIKIHGHADWLGSRQYNFKLSKRRSQRVKDFLITLGWDKEKIEFIDHGEIRPRSDNERGWGRQLNRRVELELVLLDN